MIYRVWIYDVLFYDGVPTVNDRKEVSAIEILDIGNDDEIVQTLEEAGIIKEGEKVTIDGDEHILYIDSNDGTPICEIVEEGY